MNTATGSVDTIYIVKAGDSLSRIAQQFYGDAQAFAPIAKQNNISNAAQLAIGQKLVIPALPSNVQTMAQTMAPTAATVPTAPAGSPVTQETIETVTVTAQRPWYTDWRVWATTAAAFGLYIAFSGRGSRRHR